MNERFTRRAALAGAGSMLALAGCQPSSPDRAGSTAVGTAAGGSKVKVAYLGLTCEAALFVAQEKGFFQEEGLEVDFLKTDWEGLRDGLGLGKFDANYTLLMYLLKPIETGLDVKITGGVHKGCLRTQVPPDSPIKTAADLKGKKIGVPAMGSPPFLFTYRVLSAAGLNPERDVEWVMIGPEVQGLALDNKQVDAVANSEPLGSILMSAGKARTVADQAVDEPYKDEYCCVSVVNGELARSRPELAARITRAILKGAAWVDQNPSAAAQLSVDKKYIAASAEINAHAIAKLQYRPSVSECRQSIDQAIGDMRVAGLLKDSTDAVELANRAWMDLDGVDDQWISSLVIEKVAGGGKPTRPISTEALAAFNLEPVKTCCTLKL